MSTLEITKTEQNQYEEINDLLKGFLAADNQLINLCAELLAILIVLSQQQGSHNIPELHQYLLKCMSQLHNRGLRADYPPRLMEKVCYALCAAFDEEIMNTGWGQAAYWENHCLVAQLFKQRNAGEVFFILLEQACQNTSRMIDFIELLYLLLRLGFKGKYINSDGHALAELTNTLYDDICKHRQDKPVHSVPVLSCPWQPLRQISPLRLILVLLTILLMVGTLTHFWIKHENRHDSDPLELLVVSPTANASLTRIVALTPNIPIAFQDATLLSAFAHPDHLLLVGSRGFALLSPGSILKYNGYMNSNSF